MSNTPSVTGKILVRNLKVDPVDLFFVIDDCPEGLVTNGPPYKLFLKNWDRKLYTYGEAYLPDNSTMNGITWAVNVKSVTPLPAGTPCPSGNCKSIYGQLVNVSSGNSNPLYDKINTLIENVPHLVDPVNISEGKYNVMYRADVYYDDNPNPIGTSIQLLLGETINQD